MGVVIKTWEWILRFPTMYLVYIAVVWMWGQNTNHEVNFIERLAITALILGTMGVLIWVSHPLMGAGIFCAHMVGSIAIAWIGLTIFYIIPNWVGILVIVLLVLALLGMVTVIVLSALK